MIHKILLYVRMTLLFLVLSAILLYFAGKPIINYVLSHGNMIIAKGAPQFSKEITTDLSISVVEEAAMDLSDILVPEEDTKYAVISCERIALSAPLYYGDSEASLQKGAGQYPNNAIPGKGKPLLISGHDGTYFAPLEQIQIGDTISISTEYGDFLYKVTETKIADATDTTAYDLEQDREQLILYTCYPFGQILGDRMNRFFVYCDRIDDTTETTK